jgi:hypothetical protein
VRRPWQTWLADSRRANPYSSGSCFWTRGRFGSDWRGRRGSRWWVKRWPRSGGWKKGSRAGEAESGRRRTAGGSRAGARGEVEGSRDGSLLSRIGSRESFVHLFSRFGNLILGKISSFLLSFSGLVFGLCWKWKIRWRLWGLLVFQGASAKRWRSGLKLTPKWQNNLYFV